MIVKNESSVIKRSLGSVKHKIDYWVIVDTGSTDGTQEIIREFMQDLPGELHERPWVNFEHNRNEALFLALDKADYLLFLDADEEWVISNDFDKNALYRDFYAVRNRDQNVDLHRIGLINTKLPWYWEGVLHEEIRSPVEATGEVLEGVINYGLPRDGHRAQDPSRYKKDAEILENALLQDPNNSRYVFFLAQSYGAAGDLHSSLKYYEKRAEMGGFSPDIFWSLFTIGCLREDLHMEDKLILDAYYKAFIFDPTRAEPLHHLAGFYQKKGLPLFAYILAKTALELPPHSSLAYVLREVYDYSLLLKFACAAHSIKKFEEAKTAYLQLLAIPNLPPDAKTVVEHNLKVIAQNTLQF